MSSPRPNRRTTRRSGRGARGFTLLEVGLALLVILLLAWLGLLFAGRLAKGARHERLVSDLKAFSAAFGDYRRLRDAWPPSTHGDVTMPRGMEQALQATNWPAGSPFGGSYGWISAEAARPGTITLSAFSPAFPLKLTRADLLELDRRIDDGNLAAGRFRTGFNGWPVYLVEVRP